MKNCCQNVCQCKRSPCKQDGGEGYRRQRTWQKHGQYFIYIFMVASDVASSFVHSVPQTLELVE